MGRRTYDKAFKEAAVQLSYSSGQMAAAAACNRVIVARSTAAGHWVRHERSHGEVALFGGQNAWIGQRSESILTASLAGCQPFQTA